MNEDQQKELNDIELSIEHAKGKISLYASLVRLQKNKDFKRIIEDCYLRDFALRQVELRCRLSGEQLTDLDRQLDGISHFNLFLMTIVREAKIAESKLDADIADREDVLAEIAESNGEVI
jgi:hypothetical protein